MDVMEALWVSLHLLAVCEKKNKPFEQSPSNQDHPFVLMYEEQRGKDQEPLLSPFILTFIVSKSQSYNFSF